jgi:hypothetical protein
MAARPASESVTISPALRTPLLRRASLEKAKHAVLSLIRSAETAFAAVAATSAVPVLISAVPRTGARASGDAATKHHPSSLRTSELGKLRGGRWLQDIINSIT